MRKLPTHSSDTPCYLTLKGYKVHEPYQTELHTEQKSHNECAFKCFLMVAESGEYRCWQMGDSFSSDSNSSKKNIYTSLQLMTHFRDFLKQSGLHTNIESIKSLGWAPQKVPSIRSKAGLESCQVHFAD